MTAVAHRSTPAALAAARMFGIPAVALCGKVWHPSPERPTDVRMCPVCAERHAKLPQTPYQQAARG